MGIWNLQITVDSDWDVESIDLDQIPDPQINVSLA